MKTLMTIAASTLVTLLALVVLLRFVLPWWIGKRISAGVMDVDAGSSTIAPTISFEPVGANAPWQQAATAATLAEFVAMGYASAGRFRVPELAGMELAFAVHADGTAAAIYDHVALRTFFDVVRTATNETSAYVTSSPLFDPANTPPGAVVIGDESISPRQAIELLHELAPTGDLLVATPDNVCELAKASYERQIAHILTRSAPTVDEMRDVSERVAQATGTAPPIVDDSGRQLAAEIHRHHREQALNEMIVQEFLRTGTYSADVWERVRDRVVVVHERMSDADRTAVLPNTDGATIVGRVERPVKATLYLLPL